MMVTPIPKNKRISNPKLLRDMKKEIGYCEYYGPDYNFICLEAAHIVAKGMGGGKGPDIRENIVIVSGPASLGLGAHGLQHSGKIGIEEFWKIAAKREGITVDECKRRVRRAMGYAV